MRGYSKVIIVGNLVKDVQVKTLPSGSLIGNIVVAVNRTYKIDGEKKEEVSFIPVTLVGKQVESCKNYLKKGKQVLIEGKLKERRWKDSDGRNHSMLEIVAFNLTFLGPPPKQNQDSTKEELSDIKEELPDIEIEDFTEEENLPF